jgi:hypothetical protein
VFAGLADLLERTRLLQLLAIGVTGIAVGCAAASAFFMANRVHRDKNESILSHMGAKGTMSFMAAVSDISCDGRGEHECDPLLTMWFMGDFCFLLPPCHPSLVSHLFLYTTISNTNT